MSGPLDNPKHEKFAQALAKGMTQFDAYAAAGYAPNDGNCVRLKGYERVAARVLELQSVAAEEVKFTIADMAKQLDEDRQFARDCGTPAAAVTASMGKAKLLGMLTDKIEHSGEVVVRSLDGFYGADA
jgi:hypothetical protein